MDSKAASTACASTSTRTSFLHGAKFSTVTFTKTFPVRAENPESRIQLDFPNQREAERRKVSEGRQASVAVQPVQESSLRSLWSLLSRLPESSRHAGNKGLSPESFALLFSP